MSGGLVIVSEHDDIHVHQAARRAQPWGGESPWHEAAATCPCQPIEITDEDGPLSGRRRAWEHRDIVQ